VIKQVGKTVRFSPFQPDAEQGAGEGFATESEFCGRRAMKRAMAMRPLSFLGALVEAQAALRCHPLPCAGSVAKALKATAVFLVTVAHGRRAVGWWCDGGDLGSFGDFVWYG